MGSDFVMNIRKVLKSDEGDEKIAREMDLWQSNLKHDFKQREKYLKSYINEVNFKYGVCGIDNREILKQKIQ